MPSSKGPRDSSPRELGAQALDRAGLNVRAEPLEHAIQHRRHNGRTQRVPTNGAQHCVIYEIDAQLKPFAQIAVPRL